MDENTSVSAIISAKKSGWMLLQAGSGFLVGYICLKLQTKLGLPVPTDLQTAILGLWISGATGVIHGISNYVKHWLADRKKIPNS